MLFGGKQSISIALQAQRQCLAPPAALLGVNVLHLEKIYLASEFQIEA